MPLLTADPVPPFHVQNTGSYCGAACAQMVLASIDDRHLATSQRKFYEGAPGVPGTHRSDYASTSEHGLPWLSFPDGIVRTLNGYADLDSAFILYACDTEAELRQVLVHTLEHEESPAIVLVIDNSHWIVLCKVDVSEESGGPTVVDFFIHDPGTISNKPDFDHSAAKDKCGKPDGPGTPFQPVDPAGWTSHYATPVNLPGSCWHGKFLAVCKTSAVPQDGEFHQYPSLAAVGVAGAAYECPDSGVVPAPVSQGVVTAGPILSSERIAELAANWWSESRMRNNDQWNGVFEMTEPMTPMLVERIDRAGAEYFIVPFRLNAVEMDGREADEQRVPLVAIFDAHSGDYHEAIIKPEGTLYEYSWVDPDQINNRNQQTDVELERNSDQSQGFPFRLVWSPTDESRSRFWPFFVDARTEDAFVRIDGMRFDGLHRARP